MEKTQKIVMHMAMKNVLVKVENTDSSQYIKATPEAIRENGVEEISNINLGLQEREQPDLAIVKDIQSAKVKINGAEHIYEYNDRFTNVESEDELYNMEASIKFSNSSRNMPYTRALYESDIRYGDESKKLEVRVTYKIGIKNTSTSLLATVNTIDDYFDNKYQLIAVGTQINADGSVVEESKLNCTKPEAYNNEYQKVVITTNATVSNQSEQFVYIEFKVQGESLSEIVDDGTDNEVKLDNVVEISSYSVYDTNNEVYAGTILENGTLTVETTAVGEDTTFGKIIDMVEEAQDTKSHTEKLINRFSKYYTPAVLVIAIAVGLITKDLKLAITVMVLGCPGALVIGVPVSTVAGIGNGAKNGIIKKSLFFI